MVSYSIRKTSRKGDGVFAVKEIRLGECVMHIDLRGLKSYRLAELEQLLKANPQINGDHANYVGWGRYVIEDSAAAYMNHSCDPNCYFDMKSIAVYSVHAFRDIAAGEELTHDYTANSVDQFDGQDFWTMECHCGSANCRGRVTGDFFAMPKSWQARYYQYLPPSIKRKYKDHFHWLRQRIR